MSSHLLIVLSWLTGSTAFYYLTVRRGSLTGPGALAALALGTLVATRVGPAWLLPLFVFFLSSVVIGRLLPVAADAGDSKDKQPRDLVQVLCNGGVYGLIALLDLHPALLLVSMAVATSDTWASELGKYLRRPTYDVLQWRRVPPGLSGGVSTGGTLGGAAGAMLIAGLGYCLLPDYGAAMLIQVAGLGFMGMLLDSILGATLQARYRDPVTGALSDVQHPGSTLYSGYHWVTNDLVNVLAIALMVGAALTTFTP
ncbi:hypothetical protein LEM8419_02675 [Neolewinella maritima]|uniref:DUF92 domain-containing protein n=1 Tax=Neolewinella maritima TaxID=1383882 RepID=A0ABM9B347_9BACT|nr:DUF92 domain-containing protein [Neolewinella maritima]CAH1001769.1 hypothetical protein LEM8419_02675 [Neolewinella maritima]